MQGTHFVTANKATPFGPVLSDPLQMVAPSNERECDELRTSAYTEQRKPHRAKKTTNLIILELPSWNGQEHHDPEKMNKQEQHEQTE